VIGFHDARAAKIDRLEWHDPAGSQAGERLDRVEVDASVGGVAGPGSPGGPGALERAPEGVVAPFVPPEETWARYLRLTAQPEPGARIELPGAVRAIEQQVGEGYRSIIGEWGYAGDAGPYEWQHAQESVSAVAVIDGGDTAESATPLQLGEPVRDRASITDDVDWYTLVVPPGHRSLELGVTGEPTVGVQVSLFDSAGLERVMTVKRESEGDRYAASVEPGERYRLRITQPPTSVVFLFDSSASIGPFQDWVMDGMRAFATDVLPERESVMILPFEQPPLLADWESEPYVLQGAVNDYVLEGGSSAVEPSLVEAAGLLGDRPGTHAILLVTDAESTTRAKDREVWEALAAARPIVYGVHVGSELTPAASRDLMQDWASGPGGRYLLPTTHAEMDRAYERMAAQLRRPATYTLSATTSEVVLPPGRLEVVAPTEAPGATDGATPQMGVEIILDTSGSMRKNLGKPKRIDVAKRALRELLSETLPEGVPVALRTFGAKGKSDAARCRTRLTYPLQPLDRADATDLVDRLSAKKGTKTPIAAALAAVASDLAAVDGPRTIVLITDGGESCDGNPEAEIAALRAGGLDVRVNIVGFALSDEELKSQMAEWAATGGGSYFDATNAQGLVDSIVAAVSPPFRVYGPSGDIIAEAAADGEPIELEPGSYRVEILTDPLLVFEHVEVESGETVTLAAE
jgi:hypothetical protein